ncbi:MAG: DUF4234 domain-containing protein [Deltaproteobacteria bacterium]|nr:DUF4234 domain-containing protein [Deltaproteobacteria bacterium]
MKQRSIGMMILLTFVTLFIYPIVWMVKTKGEMTSQGAEIPSAWLMIVPFANIYFMWKWCGGVEHVTKGKLSQVVAFLVQVLLFGIGMLIIQDAFNKVSRQPLPQAQALG